MDIENLEIRGRKFRTKSDYAAGFRDNRIIEGLERKLDKTGKPVLHYHTYNPSFSKTKTEV